jgi:predicted ATPase with chaperone activity
MKRVHRLKQSKTLWSVVHNVLMVGPTGAGKTLLACAVPGILPRLTIDEALDVTRIYPISLLQDGVQSDLV